MSSITPTVAIATAPSRIARVSSPFCPGPSGRKSSPATSTPTRIASPPSFGVGVAWRLRSFGTSIAPTRRASHSAPGTRIQASTRRHEKRPDGVDRLGQPVYQHLDRFHDPVDQQAGIPGILNTGRSVALSEVQIAGARRAATGGPRSIRSPSTAPIRPLKIV